MSPIRVQPASPGCCLLSLLLLPLRIFVLPFRFLIYPSQPRYPRRRF